MSELNSVLLEGYFTVPFHPEPNATHARGVFCINAKLIDGTRRNGPVKVWLKADQASTIEIGKRYRIVGQLVPFLVPNYDVNCPDEYDDHIGITITHAEPLIGGHE